MEDEGGWFCQSGYVRTSSVVVPSFEGSSMNDELKVSWNTSMIRMIEERLKSEAPIEYEKYVKLDENDKLEYIKENWNFLNVGYDEKLLKNINAVLHPLLEKVVTKEINKEIIENYIPRSNAAMHNISEFRIILEKYANNIKPLSFEEESRLSLPYYLTVIESTFTADVNLLVYLLIKNGTKHYRTEDNGKKNLFKIKNWEKIAKETLYDKISFLRDSEFSVIADACDRDLRNSIAHMSFIVFDDGSVAYENRTIKEVTIITKAVLESKIERLLNVCHCIAESIKQFYGQKYGFST